MKVRIIKCSGPSWWYYDSIREVYESDFHDDADYYVRDIDGNRCLLLKEDCEIVSEETVEEIPSNIPESVAPTKNKYSRQIKKDVWVDVYDVLAAFQVVNPCLQHLLKKALAPGKRHHKGEREDLQDIFDSAKRALELYDAEQEMK